MNSLFLYTKKRITTFLNTPNNVLIILSYIIKKADGIHKSELSKLWICNLLNTFFTHEKIHNGENKDENIYKYIYDIWKNI